MQAGRAKTLGMAQPMTDHPQPPPRRDRRVLLAQRTRRTVAGIGERRFALLDEAGVERLEISDPEEHLAADFEHLGDRVVVAGAEPFGDVVDGAGVERDVLSGAPSPRVDARVNRPCW
ncbi:DNA ligase domain protein [Mycobacterium kansasii]|uniref:DNA ligase domain protein n=1 Tax=Mycobacterium kansasii TaxID=1768 RepID=A0A1V3XUQ0_MYCKA|nr:DNA ligase domain protein [Mycobacterium kansasii]